MGRVLEYTQGTLWEYPFSNVIENVAATHAAHGDLSRHHQQATTSGHLNLNTAAAAALLTTHATLLTED